MAKKPIDPLYPALKEIISEIVGPDYRIKRIGRVFDVRPKNPANHPNNCYILSLDLDSGDTLKVTTFARTTTEFDIDKVLADTEGLRSILVETGFAKPTEQGDAK